MELPPPQASSRHNTDSKITGRNIFFTEPPVGSEIFTSLRIRIPVCNWLKSTLACLKGREFTPYSHRSVSPGPHLELDYRVTFRPSRFDAISRTACRSCAAGRRGLGHTSYVRLSEVSAHVVCVYEASNR